MNVASNEAANGSESTEPAPVGGWAVLGVQAQRWK